MKHKKLVSVEWKDATFFSDDYSEEDIKKLIPTLCKNVGFLIAKDKHYIRIAAQWSFTPNAQQQIDYSEITIIPKSWVTKITVLEEENI